MEPVPEPLGYSGYLKSAPHSTDSPSVSIVVIGRNEGDLLADCLRSLRSIRAPAGGFELIYVDSDSVDDSCERAKAAGARVVEWPSRFTTPGGARNRGWRIASAPVVFFVDSDCTIEPDFVEAALPEFDDRSVGVVFGGVRERDPKLSVYTRVLDLDWVAPVGKGPTDYSAGIALVRRDLLQRLGGFDEALMAAEEPEFCVRLANEGFVTLGLPRLSARHVLGITGFLAYWRRLARRGYGNAQAAETLGREHGLVRELRWSRLATILAPFAVAAGVATAQPLPAVLWSCLCVAVTAPRVWAAAKRRPGLGTLTLYAAHAVTRLFPIACGAALERWDHWTRRRREPIRYKERASADRTVST